MGGPEFHTSTEYFAVVVAVPVAVAVAVAVAVPVPVPVPVPVAVACVACAVGVSVRDRVCDLTTSKTKSSNVMSDSHLTRLAG